MTKNGPRTESFSSTRDSGPNNIKPALVIMSPLSQRWGHVGLPLSARSVCHVLSICVSHSFMSVCPVLSMVQAVKQDELTQCWALLAHRLRR